MYYLPSAIFLVCLCTYVNCGVLLWSTKQFRLAALKILTDDDLNTLITYLDNPKLVILNGDPNKYSEELEKLFVDKYTAYVPTADLSFEENDIIDLNPESLANINYAQTEENILYAIVNEAINQRFKRDIENVEENDEDEKNIDNNDSPTGPVWYNAEGKAMIYSSKPLLLIKNNTNMILGTAVFAAIDSRGSYTRLNVVVNYEGRKITLRFKFIWSVSGYWTLKSVEIEDTGDNDSNTLIALTAMTASRNFSYHCTGEIVFSNPKNDVELVLYDMQAQPDSLNSIFGSAYDCISFTTVPIWSGIFVTFILLIGLAFGLGAMDSIKTMDKFDNAKTKPLTISAGE